MVGKGGFTSHYTLDKRAVCSSINLLRFILNVLTYLVNRSELIRSRRESGNITSNHTMAIADFLNRFITFNIFPYSHIPTYSTAKGGGHGERKEREGEVDRERGKER